MSKITILCGNYGSGKTEIALNLALTSIEKTTLIDLDIVNPYFRSSEHKELLESKGISVISPVFSNTLVDVPSLPAILSTVFEKKEKIIIDVGGTEIGATVLGRYSAELKKNDYEMALVVNALRPFSSANEIIDLALLIQDKSRLVFTYIINNTNMQLETKAEDIIYGMDICNEVSNTLGIPIKSVWAMSSLIESLPQNIRDISQSLELYMRPEWL